MHESAPLSAIPVALRVWTSIKQNDITVTQIELWFVNWCYHCNAAAKCTHVDRLPLSLWALLATKYFTYKKKQRLSSTFSAKLQVHTLYGERCEPSLSFLTNVCFTCARPEQRFYGNVRTLQRLQVNMSVQDGHSEAGMHLTGDQINDGNLCWWMEGGLSVVKVSRPHLRRYYQGEIEDEPDLLPIRSATPSWYLQYRSVWDLTIPS